MKQFLTILILLSSLAGLGQTPKTISQHVEFTGNLNGIYFIADISPTQTRKISWSTISSYFYTKTQSDALYAALGHVHTFASLTSKPTTLAGYGITDAAGASHTHAFSSLTSIPTTVSGYGITDVYTKTQGDARYLQSYTETDPGVSSIIKNIPVSADATTNKYLNWNGSAYVRSQVAYSQVSGTPDLSGYQLTSNLSTVTTLGSSNTLYPSQLAVKTYVDNAVTAGGGYTDENAQDAIGTILSSEFTYSDATPSISINVIAASKITQDATIGLLPMQKNQPGTVSRTAMLTLQPLQASQPQQIILLFLLAAHGQAEHPHRLRQLFPWIT
jgi:hypothetical protein